MQRTLMIHQQCHTLDQRRSLLWRLCKSKAGQQHQRNESDRAENEATAETKARSWCHALTCVHSHAAQEHSQHQAFMPTQRRRAERVLLHLSERAGQLARCLGAPRLRSVHTDETG